MGALYLSAYFIVGKTCSLQISWVAFCTKQKEVSRVGKVMLVDLQYWLKGNGCSAPSQKFHCPSLISQLESVKERVSGGLGWNVGP